jgi:hypothetical protein
LKAVKYRECEKVWKQWQIILILLLQIWELIPSILMPYFISLERSAEDRTPNGMWVMKACKKLYAGWDFNSEAQHLLHHNNMHNLNHTGNETDIL